MGAGRNLSLSVSFMQNGITRKLLTCLVENPDICPGLHLPKIGTSKAGQNDIYFLFPGPVALGNFSSWPQRLKFGSHLMPPESWLVGTPYMMELWKWSVFSFQPSSNRTQQQTVAENLKQGHWTPKALLKWFTISCPFPALFSPQKSDPLALQAVWGSFRAGINI